MTVLRYRWKTDPGRVKVAGLFALPSPGAYVGLYIWTVSLVKRFMGRPIIYSSRHKHKNDSATDEKVWLPIWHSLWYFTLRPKVLAGAVVAAAIVSERVAQYSLYWDLSYTLNGHNNTCTASWDRNMSFIIWIISRRTQTKTVVKAGNRELINTSFACLEHMWSVVDDSWCLKFPCLFFVNWCSFYIYQIL